MIVDTTKIYGLTDPRTGIVRYIGKSDDPVLRLKGHLVDHGKCHRTNWLQELIRAGLRPGVVILEEVPVTEWQDAERWWIKHFREQEYLLTNSTDGGDGIINLSEESRQKKSNSLRGHIVTEETREKIAEKATGRKHSDETLRKLKGRRHSEESRRKMSESHVGKNLSDETKHKLSLSHQGHIVTKDMRRKISQAQIGRHGYSPSDETKQKISKRLMGHKGCVHTDEAKRRMSIAARGNRYRVGHIANAETRRRLSEAHKGHIHSEETKRKMSIAQKARYETCQALQI